MLLTGDKLSHYKIISAIGAGGMGEVYLAEDTKLDRQVALKVLLDGVSADEDHVRRFVQEAKAVSALNHPNILTVFEVGVYEGSQFIATEFIKGKTLRERTRGEPLGLLEALKIVLQVAAALGAAHEAGIIHRDIKPENVMIRNDGLVKVLDFGLAKLAEVSAASVDTTLAQINTKPGMLVGTVAYMSPEQARGRKLDPRSDIFSLGIMMFELLTGKRPFEGEGHLDLISSILKDEAPPLRQVAPDLPRELERIVQKTLRKDRDHRYQHIKDLHIDIEDLRDELKFESKLTQSIQPTVTGNTESINQSNLRSSLTTSISKTRFTLGHALIFITLIAAAIGTFWYMRPATNSAAITGTSKTTELATWNSIPGELFSSASFSPDGKLIAFASTRSGSKGIWVTQSSSTDAIQITNDSFSNTDPIWSVTGNEIAFLSQRPNATGGSSTGIWRVGALGGTPRSVAPLPDGSSKLRRWTPSGKIYYEVRGELYAVEIASGASQKITSLGDNKAKWVDISNDEKKIAYATGSDDEWQIFSSDLTGSGPVEIAKGKGRIDKYISWLPDRNRLFFSVTIAEVPQIFFTTAGSGLNDRIATPETDSSIVGASPDGRSIILSSAKEESSLWSVAVASGLESPVARDLNAKLWPAVSPDSGRVTFQSIKNLSAGNKLMRASIMVASLKQGADARPILLSEDGFLPAWSPDGSMIAYLKKLDQSNELHLVDSSGGGGKRLTKDGVNGIGYSVSPYNPVENRSFSWSPDSLRIAYVAERDSVSNLWTVSPRDGAEVKVTSYSEGGFSFNCPIWSSDGKRVAFSYQRKARDENGKTIRGLRIADVTNGSVQDVFESSRMMRLIGWTSDENGLIIAEPSKEFSGLPAETKLNRIAVVGGIETTIITLKEIYYYNIFLSADRKQIAYAARSQNLDHIWVFQAAGGTPRKLTSNNDSGQYYSKLAWSPDGSVIVFGKQTRFSLLSLMTDIN